MEELLTPVSTTRTTESFIVEVSKPDKPTLKPHPTPRASTPAEALEILRAEPDYESLVSTLDYLTNCAPSFSIVSPSPLGAQLVHTIVSDIVPTYWNVLRIQGGQKPLNQLCSCLKSVAGLSSILLNLKRFIGQSKQPKPVGGHNVQDVLQTLLGLLSMLLEGKDFIESIWDTVWNDLSSNASGAPLWNEFVGIVGGGKILGISAEAEDVFNILNKKIGERYWISDGRLYCRWLAQNISGLVQRMPEESSTIFRYCVDLFSKSFRLGYTVITKEIISSFLLNSDEHEHQLRKLLSNLPNLVQREFLHVALNIIAKDFLPPVVISEDDESWWHSDEKSVSAAAGLISVITNSSSQKTLLTSWLTSSSGAGIGDGVAIRRAAVASIAADQTALEGILEKSLAQLGDQLYIKHTPTIQQEAHAQVLLLAAGYIHRSSPRRLIMIVRTGAHLGVVSNRLGASSPRARFLGMVIGEALSSLVDAGDKKLDFKVEEMSTSEARWLKSLVNVSDTISSFKGLEVEPLVKNTKSSSRRHVKQEAKPRIPETGSKIVAIEEVGDDDEDPDEDGLVPHSKPDSDEEDSEDDPTLITRNKLTAPVYVRDLIAYLRDTDNYDKQKLALQTAAPLIRRKANFGTEVSSHAEELAALLVGLQNKYEIEHFADLRLQGMIAVLIAIPLKMGQWLSKTFFDGDYSISQRASILTTLGLGARELGGFGYEDANISKIDTLPSTAFPSKSLPDRMHKLYISQASPPTQELTPVDRLSAQLSNTLIAPMAASLADKLTGPSILKVRTFSSRLAVEKARKKPIANSLAKIVADGFFFPLTGRFFVHLKAYGSSPSNVVFQPYLLALLVKTLGLLLHASGPSTVTLPQMTAEFWDLLLGLRLQSVGDVSVIEALLFALLTILEINEDKRSLVEAHGRKLLETREWVEGIFGRTGAGGSEEDEKVRMLAAGCLVRIREVEEKYQALMMGDLANFSN